MNNKYFNELNDKQAENLTGGRRLTRKVATFTKDEDGSGGTLVVSIQSEKAYKNMVSLIQDGKPVPFSDFSDDVSPFDLIWDVDDGTTSG